VSGAALADIERVYRTRYHELLRVATAVLGDADAAREAVQDAFAAVVQKSRSFRASGSLEGWIWRTVVNAARNRRREERRRCALAPAEPARNGASPDATLQERIASLPERQRLVLFLRYYADLDYATIAEVAGIAPGTVAATLHAAHAALRTELQEVLR